MDVLSLKKKWQQFPMLIGSGMFLMSYYVRYLTSEVFHHASHNTYGSIKTGVPFALSAFNSTSLSIR